MRRYVPFAFLSAVLLAGCYFRPPEQAEILVDTTPPGASCVLTGQGHTLATLEPTPAIALVDPAAAGLVVSCRRPGFADVNVPVPPYPAATRERRVAIALVPNRSWGPPR